jgi:SAV_6107-like HEPN
LLPDQSDDIPASSPPASLRADLQRAHAAILEAELAEHPGERFLAAHLAALRVAAIILTVRGGPAAAGRSGRRRSAWEVVADVAPELAEWATYFAATEPKRDAVRSGARAIVTAREADDLVRDARAFLRVVERALG